jgi:phosphatidate cytidylyltransferase
MNRDLLFRVATALVLLPLVIWLIWLGGIWFALLVGTAAALCSLELNLLPFAAQPAPAVEVVPDGASRKERQKARAAAGSELQEGGLSGAAVVSIGAAFALPLLDTIQVPFLSFKLVLAVVVVVAFADALLFERDIERAPLRVSIAVLGAVYPGLLMSALIRIRQLPAHAEWWIVLTLVVTWWNDTGGYFAGRAFGKHKLFERISPKKTWEGAVGGLFLATVGALGVKYFWIPELPFWAAALIALGASVLGPLGDLSESMFKRAFGAKDSGKLLPGHGGMLDRIDALLFNAPFVLLCARLLVDRG